MRKSIGLRCVAAAACLFAPVGAEAALTCSAPVQSFDIMGTGSANGVLEVSWSFGLIKLCNVNQDWTTPYVVTQAQCQAILAMATTSLATGKKFSVSISNSTVPPIADCTGLNAGGYLFEAPVRMGVSTN
jgi:hypothetical protein